MRIDSKKLRHVMIDCDIGQKELSERSGISRAAISNVCRGCSCAANTALRIAEALQRPLEDLLEKGGE